MGEKSTVARASNKSPSVRTTIPEKIVAEMRLGVGDVLDWETAYDERERRRVMKVKKLE